MGWLRDRPAAAALLLVLAVLAGERAAVKAQLTEPGICPFSTPLSSSDWSEERFVSEPWYEIKAFAMPGLHDAVPSGPACTRWHFSASEDGLGLHARIAYRAGDGDGVVHAFAQYMAKEKHPRFNLTFHDLAGMRGAMSRSVDMKLVATNYDDFALLWGCSEPNLFDRRVVSWVLSRRPVLSEHAEDALRSLFRRHDIRAEKFLHTDHGTCQTLAGASLTGVTEDSRSDRGDSTDSVFASYRSAADSQDQLDRREVLPEVTSDNILGSDVDDEDAAPVDAGRDEPAVSWSYLGPSGWLSEGAPQMMLVAVLLAFAAVSLLASVLTFRALLQRRLAGGPGKPVLPVRRQDIVVATLGSGVDYSRFGGLGKVQTRKPSPQTWPRS